MFLGCLGFSVLVKFWAFYFCLGVLSFVALG